MAGKKKIANHSTFHPWNGRLARARYPVRLVGDRRDLAGDGAHRAGHRRDVPDVPVPPGDCRPGRGDAAVLSDGRFTLGLGSGERLNEHVVGDAWPNATVAITLEEALEIIRLLWQGGYQSYDGRYFHLDDARVFDLPDEPPVLAVAAAKPLAAELAARIPDAFDQHVAGIAAGSSSSSPPAAKGSRGTVRSPGAGRRRRTRARSRRARCCPTPHLGGDLTDELPLPSTSSRRPMLLMP